MIGIEEYDEALKEINLFIEREIPDTLQPKEIIRNGNIKTPGISDLDIIFVFDNEFCLGDEFLSRYSKFTSNHQHGKTLFVHDPMLLNESLLQEIGYFTLNPEKDFLFIRQKEKKKQMHKGYPNRHQSLLISAEFMQFRIIQLIGQILSKNISLQGVLLRGHSFSHSLKLAVNGGVKTNSEEYPAFKEVEDIREKQKPFPVKQAEISNLHEGVIKDFYTLYRKICSEITKEVSHYNPQKNSYSYDYGLTIENCLSQNKNNISINKSIDGVEISGLGWIGMMLEDFYFRGNGSILMESKLNKELNLRRKFHYRLLNWNKQAFGNPLSGLHPFPGIMGSKLKDNFLNLNTN
ncbi:hypothetical protein [Kushneria marisflavi]|uniref:Uncharacterized protein n=1 Tax=Kushneria marisflavi TaxID=157779 RepID=A0A240UTP8_9GAMM|nr:hypothetical protein [Kushneria marisflavi]ART64453.1 hypothetical protein B9H00_16450 [Kushneria marisflavi]RKD86608.1 hypothetical protein C8D96_0050 [Kushneria marisflavi]